MQHCALVEQYGCPALDPGVSLCLDGTIAESMTFKLHKCVRMHFCDGGILSMPFQHISGDARWAGCYGELAFHLLLVIPLHVDCGRTKQEETGGGGWGGWSIRQVSRPGGLLGEQELGEGQPWLVALDCRRQSSLST